MSASPPQLAPRRRIATPAVLERERELARIIDAFEHVATGVGRAIVIEGEAGIGKSTLVQHAVAEARRRGIRLLRATGGELDRETPYGVAVELLEPAVRDGAPDLLTGPARVTAPLFGAVAGPVPDRADSQAFVHGLFWVVLNLAERGPLALVVDDAQWADDPSIRFLHRLVSRLDEMPVALVVALRPLHDPGRRDLAAELLRGHRSITHIAPSLLTEAAVGDLLARACGGPVDASLRQACWEATRGNPFLVTELIAEIASPDSPDPCAEAVPEVIPGRVGRFVEARLASLDPGTRRMAEAAAILGNAATVRRARDLAGSDESAAIAAARELVNAAILDDVPGLAFRHPLVRAGVRAAIPAPARAAMHRRAAQLLDADGVQPGELAGQLLEAERAADPRTVGLLVAAAAEASSRDEPATAAALLRRALDEPPPPDDRGEIHARLAAAEAASRSDEAMATYARAIPAVEDAERRARLRLEVGQALVDAGRWVEAGEVFADGLRDLEGGDSAVGAALEAGFLSAGWVTMLNRTEIDDRVSRILERPVLGPSYRELAAWIAFHQGAVVGSTAGEMAALVKRALGEAPIEVLVRERQLVEIASGLLLETDELPFQHDFLSAAIDAARASGPLGKAGLYAYCRAWPSYYMGRLADAIADAEEARRASELGWEVFLPAALTTMSLAHLERDDLAAAEAAIDIDLAALGPRLDAAMLLPLAAGRIAFARGDMARAVEHLERARDAAASGFMRNSVPTDWRAWLAPALVAVGRREEAREITADGVELAREWGAAWPLGAALRASATAAGGAEGLALLREAEELQCDAPARLEHTRTLADLGAALRRHGSLREARDVLARAVDAARAIGARAIMRRATQELRAAGARPRRQALTGIESLTPGEQRVAVEAASGRTNREIAQALFVTPKAVEYHLANAYRKLGIGSRAELPAALATGSPSAVVA